MECLARWAGQEKFRPAIRLALAAGAVSAVATALTGWLLAGQGGYERELLLRHQWLGFGAATLAVLSWLSRDRAWYFPLFSLGMLALVAAGHFGGSLTHGADYLFEKKHDPPDERAPVGALRHPDSVVFAGAIAPILERRCMSCHNHAKHKGGLRLDAPEWIRKGGKNGPVLVQGDPSASPLLQRLLLPLHHDDHMPPAGKPQPDPLELQLLEWWIAGGASFDLRWRDARLPGALEAALKKSETHDSAVPDVPLADPAAVAELRAMRVNVQALGAASPWLAVSFAGIPQPQPAHWAALKKLKGQIRDLDLSHTRFNFRNDLFLPDFSQITRLHLARTPVDAGIGPQLAQLKQLEFLNLAGTAVTDSLVDFLEKMPGLKNLYLWQTQITESGRSRLQKHCPGLRINTGSLLPDTVQLQLRPPKITLARSFFTDTLHLRLEYPAFRGVALYYTTDAAASPTRQSTLYAGPVVLDRTAHIRTFAAKDGWLPSPVVDAVVVKKNLSLGLVRLAKPPSPKYPARGAVSLTDDKIAELQGEDTWLGYEGEHLVAFLDMGRVVSVREVFVHCLENNVAWIFKPRGIQVATSVDGKQFRAQGSRSFPTNTRMGEMKTHLLSCPLPEPVRARYLRVRVQSPLQNPPWHPGKGQKCWIFVDELVVDGAF